MVPIVVLPDLHDGLLEDLEPVERSLIVGRFVFVVDLSGLGLGEDSLATQERAVFGIEALVAHSQCQEDCQEDEL